MIGLWWSASARKVKGSNIAWCHSTILRESQIFMVVVKIMDKNSGLDGQKRGIQQIAWSMLSGEVKTYVVRELFAPNASISTSIAFYFKRLLMVRLNFNSISFSHQSNNSTRHLFYGECFILKTVFAESFVRFRLFYRSYFIIVWKQPLL